MVRKTVTLVFCDVEDSTPLGEQLDPEALRGVWTRYHETARAVLERHGGTIELVPHAGPGAEFVLVLPRRPRRSVGRP